MSGSGRFVDGYLLYLLARASSVASAEFHQQVRAQGDGTGAGAEHRITVSVVSETAGFLAAKQAAGAVSDALDGAMLSLARGRLVALRFLRARALRTGAGQRRRIDLTFRARVDDGA